MKRVCERRQKQIEQQNMWADTEERQISKYLKERGMKLRNNKIEKSKFVPIDISVSVFSPFCFIYV